MSWWGARLSSVPFPCLRGPYHGFHGQRQGKGREGCSGLGGRSGGVTSGKSLLPLASRFRIYHMLSLGPFSSSRITTLWA